jgi:hypothetical protein
MVWKSFDRKGVGRIINGGAEATSHPLQSSFELELDMFEEQIEAERVGMMKEAALILFRKLIDKSPVDTGRFRCSWVAAAEAANRDIPTFKVDDGGKEAEARVLAALSDLKPGQKFIISNNLPYALMLEYGWSGQAPNGFADISVQETEAEIKSKYRRE